MTHADGATESILGPLYHGCFNGSESSYAHGFTQLNSLLLRDGTQETCVDIAKKSELVELAHASLQESRPAKFGCTFTLPLSPTGASLTHLLPGYVFYHTYQAVSCAEMKARRARDGGWLTKSSPVNEILH